MMRSSASRLMSAVTLGFGLLVSAVRRHRLARRLRWERGGRGGRLRSLADQVEEPPEQVERDGEERRGIVLRGDLGYGLEIAQLDRRRLGTDDVSGLRQPFRSLQLS